MERRMVELGSTDMPITIAVLLTYSYTFQVHAALYPRDSYVVVLLLQSSHAMVIKRGAYEARVSICTGRPIACRDGVFLNLTGMRASFSRVY